jgi:hypothetical protein
MFNLHMAVDSLTLTNSDVRLFTFEYRTSERLRHKVCGKYHG